MNTPDQSFDQWKEEMRQDALEKEVKRLKQFSSRQTGQLHRLRRTLMFISIFFTALFVLLLFNGLIKWPKQKEDLANVPTRTQIEESNEHTQSQNLPQVELAESVQVVKATQDTLTFKIPDDGILFSVQIGAFSGLDLNRFSNNMITLHQDSFEGINQLSLGVFPQYGEAAEFLEVIKGIGFNDAFVMATRNGRRIKIQEALMTRQKERPADSRHTNNLSVVTLLAPTN